MNKESQSKFLEFSKEAQQLSCQALSQLRKLVLAIPNDEELFAQSVHYEKVDKLVLWNSDDKILQIRLHIYAEQPCSLQVQDLADIAQAHNHRWNFFTKILYGGYLHTTYRLDLLEAKKYCLTPMMIRHEAVGSSYALHHTHSHSIIENPNTVSLIVRGPIQKESFQIITESQGEVQLKDSLSLQTTTAKKQKTMTLVDYEKVFNQLVLLKVI